MADGTAKPPADPRQSQIQLGAIIGILALATNGLFFFLSSAYYADRARRFGDLGFAGLGATRMQFALFTAIVAAAAIAAVFKPRIVALGVPGLVSLAGFIAAFGAFSKGFPVVVGSAALVLGAALPALVWYAHLGSRAAWSGLCSAMGVLTVVMLFASPRIRAILGGGLWTAMIIPGVLAVGLAALMIIRREFAERPKS